MIEKINFNNSTIVDAVCAHKINELVDVVNTIQKEREAEWFEIQEWIGILGAVRKSVNVHEKQIDELQMKLEPEKCEIPADPYTEQRKWIGKLCRFWNDDDKQYVYDILDCIYDDLDGYLNGCFVSKQHGSFYNCEVVRTYFDELFQD